MDYDKTDMPGLYDKGVGYSEKVLNEVLDLVADWIPSSVATILDLGCGTGRYSAGLAARFGASVLAIDPSAKMLAEARRKTAARVLYLRASAESLPVSGASVDMIFMSMVFHHFGAPDLAVRECYRVLRAEHTVCLRAVTTDIVYKRAYTPFFPGYRAWMEHFSKSQELIESVFRNAGFRLAHHKLVTTESAPTWPDYADRISHRADSILIRLSNKEFERGLAALYEYAATAPKNVPVNEPVDFFVFRAA